MDSEDPVVIEADTNDGTEAAISPAEVKETASPAEVVAAAGGTNWFESLDKETRQQLAEARKGEGNELFAKACFLAASKKYTEVLAIQIRIWLPRFLRNRIGILPTVDLFSSSKL